MIMVKLKQVEIVKNNKEQTIMIIIIKILKKKIKIMLKT